MHIRETLYENPTPPSQSSGDEIWLQHWSLLTWENAEEVLNSMGLYAFDESSTVAYVFLDDTKNNLRLNNCWLWEEYEKESNGIPRAYHVKYKLSQEADGSVRWMKASFASFAEAIKALPKSIHREKLMRSSRFSFQRQPLFYLGTQCVEAYVDSMKIGEQYYNIGTFKRIGGLFNIPNNNFLVPARSKASQMLFLKETVFYNKLKDLGIVKDVKCQGHLSSKPFSPRKEFPPNFGEELLATLTNFLQFPPDLLKEVEEEAKKDNIPSVILLKAHASSIDPCAFERGEILSPLILC